MHGTWKEFLDIVREEVGSRVVETWFKSIIFERWDAAEKVVYLSAPNAFVKDWIHKNYIPLLQLHLGRLLHVEAPRVIIGNGVSAQSASSAKSQDNPEIVQEKNVVSIIPASVIKTNNSLIKTDKNRHGHLNKNYTFDNFVVGPSNSLSYAAAHAITEQPGYRYNPLFIYGKSGLGKTHLLHAIGNEILNRYQNARILYQTADRFVTEFISAIRFNKIHKFQYKYHAIDVLLVDDLQFISHKEHTQEAFFHIFNALYESRKQIVFSSDMFPQDIEGIADRLRSRLASGLVTDIYMPSLETKVAILKKKAEISSEILDDDVAHYIASQDIESIRELEGALIRVLAFASLTKQPVTLELAERVLQRLNYQKKPQSIDFERVMTCVNKYYSYTLSDICSKNRNKEISEARQVAMFLMKKLTDKSLRDIGNYLGGRDHSTIMHGLQKIEQTMQQDQRLKERIGTMEKEIFNT